MACSRQSFESPTYQSKTSDIMHKLASRASTQLTHPLEILGVQQGPPSSTCQF